MKPQISSMKTSLK